MRSTHLVGFLAGALGISALAIGCGSSSSSSTGGSTDGSGGSGGNGSGTSTSASTGIPNGSGTTGPTGTTTGSGGGGGSFPASTCPTTAADAAALTLDDTSLIGCTLGDPTTSVNYFKLSGGKKGQALAFLTSAKSQLADPFDTTYVDTVLTLFDSSMKQIARNDDPDPRNSNDATLYTVLPADGDYYVTVEDCNAAFGATNCSLASDITTLDYGVGVISVKGTDDGVSQAVEPDDTTAQSVPFKYAVTTTAGSYYISQGFGSFETATDVDYFTVNLPSDLTISEGRAILNVGSLVAGTDGNGSTAQVGLVTLIDATDMSIVAQTDLSIKDTVSTTGDVGAIGVPVTLGHQYFLKVEKVQGAVGANDFYFLNSYGSGSNPVEAADATNDTTPEVLTDQNTGANADDTFTAEYFVDGDINKSGDVDTYSLAVPAGTTVVTAVCGAQRDGSGLRNLKMSLFKADGTTALGTGSSITEAADKAALLPSFAIPSGVAKVIVKLEATQDATVKSTFYRCGFRMAAAASN